MGCVLLMTASREATAPPELGFGIDKIGAETGLKVCENDPGACLGVISWEMLDRLSRVVV